MNSIGFLCNRTPQMCLLSSTQLTTSSLAFSRKTTISFFEKFPFISNKKSHFSTALIKKPPSSLEIWQPKPLYIYKKIICQKETYVYSLDELHHLMSDPFYKGIIAFDLNQSTEYNSLVRKIWFYDFAKRSVIDLDEYTLLQMIENQHRNQLKKQFGLTTDDQNALKLRLNFSRFLWKQLSKWKVEDLPKGELKLAIDLLDSLVFMNVKNPAERDYFLDLKIKYTLVYQKKYLQPRQSFTSSIKNFFMR